MLAIKNVSDSLKIQGMIVVLYGEEEFLAGEGAHLAIFIGYLTPLLELIAHPMHFIMMRNQLALKHGISIHGVLLRGPSYSRWLEAANSKQ